MTLAVETVSTQSPPVPPIPPVDTRLIFADDFRLIPLSSIRSSDLNPRKEFDEESLAELAASILEKDLLQPIVVREPLEGVFEIVAGERRFRALQLLADASSIADDYKIPCCIRDVDDLELIELATIENVQRDELPVLDQAEAYTKMLELGSDIPTIAIKTGLSETTIKRRLAIAEKLCPDAKMLVRDGFINIGQAEALTIVNFETQDSVLEAMEHGNIPQNISPAQIRSMLLREKYLVEHAIFDIDLYLAEGGTITSDLFGDSPDSFDDAELFIKYQFEALDVRKAELKEKWAWVRNEANFYSWEYKLSEDSDDEFDETKLGAIIVIDANSSEVTIYESVIDLHDQDDPEEDNDLADFNPNASRSTTASSSTAASPSDTSTSLSKQSGSGQQSATTVEEPKPKGFTTKAIIAVNQERTKALQHAVLNSKSQKLPLVIILMGLMESNRVAISQEVIGMDDIVLTDSLAEVRESWKEKLAAFTAEPPPHIREHRLQSKLSDVNQTALFEFLLDLKKSELEDLLRYFAASSIAKWNKGSYKLEVDDFTTALVDASHAEKALASTFSAEDAFFKLFSKDQLAEMQEELGQTGNTLLKKTEQITAILSDATIDVFQPSVLSFKLGNDDSSDSEL